MKGFSTRGQVQDDGSVAETPVIETPVTGSVQEGSHGGHAALDFEVVFRDNVQVVARLAASLGGPRGDVDDIVQEVFLVAFRRAHAFRPGANVRAWLFGITARIVRKRRYRERLRAWFRLDDSREELLASPGATPIQDLESKQIAEEVHAVLDGLDEKYRTVLVLFEIEGFSGEEIAAILELNMSTVWVRLHRAREAFARRLQKLRAVGKPVIR